MRRDGLTWMVRGIGLTIGVFMVIGAGSIALKAGNVLVLVFVAILLASALEPAIHWIRAERHSGAGRRCWRSTRSSSPRSSGSSW